jgi:transposase-like protein
MAGKKGSSHSGWEDRFHIKECIEAYKTHQGNCKRAARHLQMTHQYLRWVWIRAGLKPKGTSKRYICESIIEECFHASVLSVSKKHNIPVSTLRKRYVEYKKKADALI